MIAVNTHIKFVGTALLWGFFSFLSPCFLIAQSDTSFNVFGIVKGDDGVVLPGASVYAMENPRFGTSTNSKGEYSLTLPHSGPWTLKCSMVGFTTKKTPIEFVTESQQLHVTISLLSTVKIGEAQVLSHGEKNTTIKRIDPKVANKIPTPRGTIEDVLLQAPVNFTSELSSSYNVRGGSFDENLMSNRIQMNHFGSIFGP